METGNVMWWMNMLRFICKVNQIEQIIQSKERFIYPIRSESCLQIKFVSKLYYCRYLVNEMHETCYKHQYNDRRARYTGVLYMVVSFSGIGTAHVSIRLSAGCFFYFIIALHCLRQHTVAGLGIVRVYVHFRSITLKGQMAVHGTTDIQYSNWRLASPCSISVLRLHIGGLQVWGYIR